MTTSVIAADEAKRLAEQQGGDDAAMLALLPQAAEFARPPISNFRVGAVARGESGALYLGANLEFVGEALSFCVHAEQSAVTNAWMSGERGVDAVAVTAAPCGYCRQFLNELATAEHLTILIAGSAPQPLTALLPSAFGPRDLGIDGGLMSMPTPALKLAGDGHDALAQEALAAAARSYAPYSHNYAGVALATRDGATFAGAYAENAAFNPSMSPAEVALSRLNLAGRAFDQIVRAVLVETSSKCSQADATRAVLRAVGGVEPEVVTAIEP